MKLEVMLLATACSLAPGLFAQQPATPAITLKATAAGDIPISRPSVVMSAMCDDAGNVYTRPFDPDDPMASSQAPVLEVTPGKTAGSLRITHTFQPPHGARTFFVREGELYVLTGPHDVVEFASSGPVKTQVPLEGLDSGIEVWHLAVFKSGEYLLFGVTGKNLRTPLTAVFTPDGRLVKKIYEPEDEDARLKAEGGDPRYDICCSNSGNAFAFDNADVAAGADGNVYLLHGVSPPLIYVISPAGEVVRKLRIDAGDPALTANSIRFYAGRLAVGFDWLGHVPQNLIKVIDLKGNSIADYEVRESASDLDPILACYGSEGFTLVPRGGDTTLHLFTVKLP
jgi:hypothetical protein